MSDIQITRRTEEPLLKRKAVTFHVTHEGGPTPKRKEMKSKLSILLSTEEPLVVIDSFKTQYGVNRTAGRAFVYADETSLKVAEGKKKVQKEREGKAKKAAPGAAAPAAQ